MSIHHRTESSFVVPSDEQSNAKARSAIESLSHILDPLPPSLSSSETPALSLLSDPDLAAEISSRLREPNSGAGDNNLCRWLYDTFQSSDPNLQLVVLRFLPIIAGLYLSRAVLRKPLAGFEAILLALYAHETTSRGGQPLTVNVPDLTHCSLYHETKAPVKSNTTEINLAIISPSLEPHGTVRSTKRARIVGVALELYYNKIAQMPMGSKIELCEFCVVWAGQDGHMFVEADEDEDGGGETKEELEVSTVSNGGGGGGEITTEDGEERDVTNEDGDGDEGRRIEDPSSSSTNEDVNEAHQHQQQCFNKQQKERKEGRIPLPWELLQPALRILGHCLMGPMVSEDLKEAARVASRSLYARALHDMNPQAILATRSLLRIGKMVTKTEPDIDHTEISDFKNPVIII